MDTTFENLVERLDKKIPRPLFANIGQAKKLYDLRYPLYQAYSDFSVKTDNKSPQRVAEEIIQLVKV